MPFMFVIFLLNIFLQLQLSKCSLQAHNSHCPDETAMSQTKTNHLDEFSEGNNSCADLVKNQVRPEKHLSHSVDVLLESTKRHVAKTYNSTNNQPEASRWVSTSNGTDDPCVGREDALYMPKTEGLHQSCIIGKQAVASDQNDQYHITKLATYEDNTECSLHSATVDSRDIHHSIYDLNVNRHVARTPESSNNAEQNAARFLDCSITQQDNYDECIYKQQNEMQQYSFHHDILFDDTHDEIFRKYKPLGQATKNCFGAASGSQMDIRSPSKNTSFQNNCSVIRSVCSHNEIPKDSKSHDHKTTKRKIEHGIVVFDQESEHSSICKVQKYDFDCTKEIHSQQNALQHKKELTKMRSPVQECSLTSIEMTSTISNCASDSSKSFTFKINGNLNVPEQSNDTKHFNSEILNFAKYYLHNKERIVGENKRIISSQKLDESVHDPKMLSLLSKLSSINYCEKHDKIKDILVDYGLKNNIQVSFSEVGDFTQILHLKNIHKCLSRVETPIEYCKKTCEIYSNGVDAMKKAIEYPDKCKIFTGYVRNTFFSKHAINDYFTIKVELWLLQMFMLEIYFYLVWWLEEIEESIITGNCIKCNFLDEMNCIHSLVYTFHLNTLKGSVNYNIQGIKCSVGKYRGHIKKTLDDNYKDSAQFYFYTHAMDCHKYSIPSIITCGSNLLHVLAFATRSKVFDILAKEVKAYESAKKIEITYKYFYHDKLNKKGIFKVEYITILQSMVSFLKQMKSKSFETSETMVFVPFRRFTYMASPVIEDGIINIKSVTTDYMVNYFQFEIYRIITE